MLTGDAGVPPVQPAEPEPPGEPDDDTPTLPEREIARIESGDSFVAWIAPTDDRSGPEIVIGGAAGSAPIVDGELAESVSIVGLYLSLVPEDAALPDALAPFATPADLELAASREERAALRLRAAHAHERIEARFAEVAATPHTIADALCSAGDIAAARAAFGDGYTSNDDCGDDGLGFVDRSRTYYYCNLAGEDCDYELGAEDIGVCMPQPSNCDFISGTTDVRSWRDRVSGNPVFQNHGYRIRYFAYNCTGNGDMRMRIRTDDGPWTTWTIPVNGWQLRLRGTSRPIQEYAIARDYVSYGLWQTGVQPGNSDDRWFRIEVLDNAGASDAAIVCADIQQSLSMSDSGSCHQWCDDDSCSGSCWD